MMKLFLLAIITLILTSEVANAQNNRFQLPEYCRQDSAQSVTIIGKKVKIWHEGGVYSTLNTDTAFSWPSSEAKTRGGENGWGHFRPKTGDIGIVVRVFTYPGNSPGRQFIYLLKIGEYYVPIDCFYITDIDKPDSDHMRDWDSLKNIDYAKGCKFKLANVNGNFSGAGESKIDSVSETYACDLIAKGIDTIMLCKGSPFTSGAVVFWENKGIGYSTAFFKRKNGQLRETGIKPISLSPLLNYFFSNKLDTITQRFKPKLLAAMPDLGGLIIQVYTPNSFFRQFVPQLALSAFKNEPLIIWWQMVSDKVGAIAK